MKLMVYRPFKEARSFVHKLKLKSARDWRNYCDSGNKPADIPNRPDHYYSSLGWRDYGDWLGTNEVATYLREYLPIEKAKKFVATLNIKNRTEWMRYAASGNKPNNIPANPYNQYNNSGWNGYSDWLGSGKPSFFYRTIKSFTKARSFVHRLRLKNVSEWRRYCKQGLLPHDIPTNPDHSYKNKGWIGFGDWLGTGKIATWKRNYLDFQTARTFVRSLKLKNQQEWIQYAKSSNKPENIPANPSRTYSNKGWIGYGDWLGTGRVANFNIKFRPFNKAKKFVRSLKLKSSKEWIIYAKSGKKPNDIPAKPQGTYKNKGWVSMGDWLGTNNIANRFKKFRKFTKATAFTRAF